MTELAAHLRDAHAVTAAQVHFLDDLPKLFAHRPEGDASEGVVTVQVRVLAVASRHRVGCLRRLSREPELPAPAAWIADRDLTGGVDEPLRLLLTEVL